jgi:hypothetical protein
VTTPDDGDQHDGGGIAVWILPILGLLVVVGFLVITVYGR